MKNFVIREPTVADSNVLASLSEQLGYPVESKDIEKNILLYSSIPFHKAWIFEIEDTVIGYVAVAITHYFHRQGSFLRIIALVVDQHYRKLGVGKKLLKVVEDYARQKNCSHVELSSGMHRAKLGSHDFYRSLGYFELNDIKKYFGKKLNSEKM
ncbi:MAG: GNAT family N-acetyltransferase [Parachlamydiales bacterium]|nr:GNAT family N-acetyltransferase [Parachlamydiales bacterium]